MAVPEIESRVALLEAKVEQLQRLLQTGAREAKPWWEHNV